MSEPKSINAASVPAKLQPIETTPLVRARPQVLSATPDALSLLKSLRRRWALALGLGIVGAVVIGGATWLIVPRAKYTAVATMQVATHPRRIMFDPKESQTDYRTYQRTQVTLIKNRMVLKHAVSQPEVAKLPTIRAQVDPEEWLDEQLKVEFPGGSEVLQISLSGDRAEDLHVIVNAVVQSYKTLIVDEEKTQRSVRLSQLKDLWKKYQDDLVVKRKELRTLATSVGSSDQQAMGLAQQFKTEALALLQRARMEAQQELMKARAELNALENGPGPDPEARVPEANILEHVNSHPEVQRLRGVVADLEQKYRHNYNLSKRKSDPSVEYVRQRWEAASKELKATTEKVRQSAAEQVRSGGTGGDRLANQARAQQQVTMWENYSNALAADIENLQKESKEMTAKSLDLENERDDIAVVAGIARQVEQEVESVQVELNAPERIRILSKAELPKKKDEYKNLKAGGIAALGAFISALVGISFWEFRARRVDTAEEVVSGLGMTLVGSLPPLPNRSRLRIGSNESAAEKHWQNLMVESIDATRTMLLHASSTEAVRLVMVTSAVKGEGKTSLSCHLATSLARTGRRTLLVDCDLRSPAAHRLFEMPPVPGVCELLRGGASLADVIYETPAGGLDMIPAGRCDALALQALARGELRPHFDQLRARYDFIIADSAPVLPVADSLLIGQSVDGVLFSVLRDVSRLPAIYSAHERLSALGVKMLGAVVNGVQGEHYSYAYSYGSEADA